MNGHKYSKVCLLINPRFIGAGEKQVTVVVFKGSCNLFPISSLFGFHGREHFRATCCRIDLTLKPSVVPVNIKYHKKAVLNRIIDHLLYLSHPSSINLMCCLVSMHVPGRRNTYSLETGCFYGIKKR